MKTETASLVTTVKRVSEGIFGPSQEAMAAAENLFLDLVEPYVQKAGVQPGQIHQFIISELSLFSDGETININILMGQDGVLSIDSVTNGTEKVKILKGKKRLAVINEQIKDFRKLS